LILSLLKVGNRRDFLFFSMSILDQRGASFWCRNFLPRVSLVRPQRFPGGILSNLSGPFLFGAFHGASVSGRNLKLLFFFHFVLFFLKWPVSAHSSVFPFLFILLVVVEVYSADRRRFLTRCSRPLPSINGAFTCTCIHLLMTLCVLRLLLRAGDPGFLSFSGLNNPLSSLLRGAYVVSIR